MNMRSLISICSAYVLMATTSIGAFDIGWGYRDAKNCSTIMETICDDQNSLPTSILCEAIQLAGLQDEFDTDTWTIFAPVDDAFETLPEDLIINLLEDNTRGLIELLAFHSVPGEVVTSTDLECDSRLFMANEDFSVTYCDGNQTFQIGLANMVEDYPEIIDSDIKTCNGIIHKISGVMQFESFLNEPVTNITVVPSAPPITDTSVNPTPFPSVDLSDITTNSTSPSISPFVASQGPSISPSVEPPEPCSITEIACDSANFSYLCASLMATGFDEMLDNYNATFTMFAPSNEAFEKLGEVAIAFLLAPKNIDVLAQILSFHLVGDEALFSQDLSCKETIEMENGKDSRTVCRDEGVFQKGKGNSRTDMPKIIEADIEACNGVIHVVDEVMLYKSGPDLGLPPTDATFAPTGTPSPTDLASPAPSGPEPEEPGACKVVDELICETPKFSILCEGLATAGISLSEGRWTVFAPNNKAFLELPPKFISKLTKNMDLMSNLLMFHTIENQILHKDDLPCVAGENLLEMANGKDSRTLCRDERPGHPVPKYQKGKYNPDNDIPEFVNFDMHACNGVIHELDGVLLYRSTSRQRTHSNDMSHES